MRIYIFFFTKFFEHHWTKPNFRVDYKCWNISLIIVWLCDCVFSWCYRVNAHIMTSKNSRQLDRIHIKSHIITENVTLFCKISKVHVLHVPIFTVVRWFLFLYGVFCRATHTSLVHEKTRPFIISELTICFVMKKKNWDTKYVALEGLCTSQMHVFEWWSSKEAYPMISNNIFLWPLGISQTGICIPVENFEKV